MEKYWHAKRWIKVISDTFFKILGWKWMYSEQQRIQKEITEKSPIIYSVHVILLSYSCSWIKPLGVKCLSFSTSGWPFCSLPHHTCWNLLLMELEVCLPIKQFTVLLARLPSAPRKPETKRWGTNSCALARGPGEEVSGRGYPGTSLPWVHRHGSKPEAFMIHLLSVFRKARFSPSFRASLRRDAVSL